LAALISVVGGAQGLETDVERMDCERLGGIFLGKGHGNGSFSVSSSLQYKGGRGEGVGVGVMGLGGVEGMGVGGGESPSKKSLSSWFRMPGSARKTKSVTSYTPSKEREGGGWGVGGGSLADVGGEVDCREFVRLLPLHNPDGSVKSDLNIAIIVPGLIVMGSPAAHGVGRGRGEGGRDWVGDVANALRGMCGNRYLVVNTNVGSSSYDSSWFGRQVVRLPIADHSPPTMRDIFSFLSFVEASAGLGLVSIIMMIYYIIILVWDRYP
jgi:hypothetical protein